MSDSIIIDTGKDESGNLQQSAVTLLDIANIDMAAVEEFRFENRPAGVYQWRVKSAGLETMEVTDRETQQKISRGVVVVELEVVNCLALVDPALNPADQIDKSHRENFFLSDISKGLGRLKAMMTDSGFAAAGSLNEVLAAFQGFEFVSDIKQTKDKNDPDRVYSNINKAKPLAASELPHVTPGPAVAAAATATATATATPVEPVAAQANPVSPVSPVVAGPTPFPGMAG